MELISEKIGGRSGANCGPADEEFLRAHPNPSAVSVVRQAIALREDAQVPKLPQVCLFLCLNLLAQSARAEPVYDFVIHCKQEPLGKCFQLIQDRLMKLNAGARRRICLPRAFGTTLFGSVGVPVSVLEHVRLGLSSARFGSAGDDVDDTIATLVNSIYPCE